MVEDIQLLFNTLRLINKRIQPNFSDRLEIGIWYPDGRTMPEKFTINYAKSVWGWWWIFPCRNKWRYPITVFEIDTTDRKRIRCILGDESVKKIVTEEMDAYSRISDVQKINIVCRDLKPFREEWHSPHPYR